MLKTKLAYMALGSEQLHIDPKIAIEYFTSAIEKGLNYPQVFWRRRRVWLELKQYALAIQDFDRGFEGKLNFLGIEKTMPYIWFYRAQANIGLLTTINADKEDERADIIKQITIDLISAEQGAGIVKDDDLIKDIVEFKHLHLKNNLPR